MVTAGPAVSPAREEEPGRATLHRLYVVEQCSMADLQARYRVGSPTVRRWLLAAGIQIRSSGSGGFRRQLTAPTRPELAALAKDSSTPEIATRLGVSPPTVRRWFAEAGLTPPSGSLKNRPHSALQPMPRPTPGRLRQLYAQDGLSIAAVAQRLEATPHLVRTWLREDNIPIRPAGGRPGSRRPGRIGKPPPPAAELRRLREQQRLSRSELGQKYGVHPQTVSKWLAAAGLPGHLPPPGPAVPDGEIAAMYRAEPITAAEIARRLHISDQQVLDALHREHIRIDPGRRVAAVPAAQNRRRPAPHLPADQAEKAVHYYQDQGWSYRMIGEQLGVSPRKVRAELQRRRVPVHPRQPIGPGSRASRTQAPIEELRRLYVESEWSAEEVAAQLDCTAHVVLRTGHAHGVPIRQGSGPAASATLALIDGLYRDDHIAEVLDRHAVPRRPAGGNIAMRFPDPVPLTTQLLDDLYTGAGCSSNQIELLTGQPQAVIRANMHRLDIPLRAEHISPALLRLREAARHDFLTQIAAEYRAFGSTGEGHGDCLAGQ